MRTIENMHYLDVISLSMSVPVVDAKLLPVQATTLLEGGSGLSERLLAFDDKYYGRRLEITLPHSPEEVSAFRAELHVAFWTMYAQLGGDIAVLQNGGDIFHDNQLYLSHDRGRFSEEEHDYRDGISAKMWTVARAAYQIGDQDLYMNVCRTATVEAIARNAHVAGTFIPQNGDLTDVATGIGGVIERANPYAYKDIAPIETVLGSGQDAITLHILDRLQLLEQAIALRGVEIIPKTAWEDELTYYGLVLGGWGKNDKAVGRVLETIERLSPDEAIGVRYWQAALTKTDVERLAKEVHISQQFVDIILHENAEQITDRQVTILGKRPRLMVNSPYQVDEADAQRAFDQIIADPVLYASVRELLTFRALVTCGSRNRFLQMDTDDLVTGIVWQINMNGNISALMPVARIEPLDISHFHEALQGVLGPAVFVAIRRELDGRRQTLHGLGNLAYGLGIEYNYDDLSTAKGVEVLAKKVRERFDEILATNGRLARANASYVASTDRHLGELAALRETIETQKGVLAEQHKLQLAVQGLAQYTGLDASRIGIPWLTDLARGARDLKALAGVNLSGDGIVDHVKTFTELRADRDQAINTIGQIAEYLGVKPSRSRTKLEKAILARVGEMADQNAYLLANGKGGVPSQEGRQTRISPPEFFSRHGYRVIRPLDMPIDREFRAPNSLETTVFTDRTRGVLDRISSSFASGKRMVLINGPAGCGKTTIASLYATAVQAPTAMYHATQAGNATDTLLTTMTASGGSTHVRPSKILQVAMKGGLIIVNDAQNLSVPAWTELQRLMDAADAGDSLDIYGEIYPIHSSTRFVITANMGPGYNQASMLGLQLISRTASVEMEPLRYSDVIELAKESLRLEFGEELLNRTPYIMPGTIIDLVDKEFGPKVLAPLLEQAVKTPRLHDIASLRLVYHIMRSCVFLRQSGIERGGLSEMEYVLRDQLLGPLGLLAQQQRNLVEPIFQVTQIIGNKLNSQFVKDWAAGLKARATIN